MFFFEGPAFSHDRSFLKEGRAQRRCALPRLPPGRQDPGMAFSALRAKTKAAAVGNIPEFIFIQYIMLRFAISFAKNIVYTI